VNDIKYYYVGFGWCTQYGCT